MIRTGGSITAGMGPGIVGDGAPCWKVYPTPKVVRINDTTLGLLRHACLIAIFLFIVVFHIMFRGSHLSLAPVNGVVRLQLRDPSEGSCDPFKSNCTFGFKSMSELPYCRQSNQTGVYQKSCEYWDSVELRQTTDEGMLIPTRVMTFMQRDRCHPGPQNGWSCNGSLYKFVDQDGSVLPGNNPSPVRDVFIADIENFEILLDHSAHSVATRTSSVEEYDFQMVGSYMECTPAVDSGSDNKSAVLPDDRRKLHDCVEHPIVCVHDKCPPGSVTPDSVSTTAAPSPAGLLQRHLRGPPTTEHPVSYEALEAADDPDLVNEFQVADEWLRKHAAVSTHKGDIFSIGRLVAAAGAGLDTNVSAVSLESFRNDGFVLLMRIEYSNDSPWVGLQVTPWRPVGPTMRYTYRIMTHSTGDVKFRKVDFVHDATTGDVTREVDEFRGIRIEIEQTGAIKVWDTMQLMFLVTTTLALLAMAQFFLDYVAMNCMKNSAEYRRLKYETGKGHSYT